MVPPFAVHPFAVAAAGATAWWSRRRGQPRRQTIALALLVLCFGWILSMTLFPLPLRATGIGEVPAGAGRGWNLIPLRTIAAQAEYETWHERVRQLGGNILVFAPLGVLLPLAAPRAARFGVVVAAGLLFSVGVELTQLAVSSMLGYAYRVADVDDVMLNVLGVVLGYGLYRFVRSR